MGMLRHLKRIDFQELCIEKNASIPPRAGRSPFSGQRRMLRPILRSGDLQSQVPDMPWRFWHPKPGNGQDDEYQAGFRSGNQEPHGGADVYGR